MCNSMEWRTLSTIKRHDFRRNDCLTTSPTPGRLFMHGAKEKFVHLRVRDGIELATLVQAISEIAKASVAVLRDVQASLLANAFAGELRAKTDVKATDRNARP